MASAKSTSETPHLLCSWLSSFMTNAARDHHFALLRRIKARIKADNVQEEEFRWYEIWDPILNWIAQRCSAPGEVGVAPQYSLTRPVFKNLNVQVQPSDGEGNLQGQAAASTSATSTNATSTTTPNPSSTSAVTDDTVDKESRIPDFVLIRSTTLRSLLVIVEIKPKKQQQKERKPLTVVTEYVEQMKLQVEFAFATEHLSHQDFIIAFLGIGDTFRYAVYQKHHVSTLPLHRVGLGTEAYEPLRRSTRGPVWKNIHNVFAENTAGTLCYSGEFMKAINQIMALYSLQVSW
ncbi:hypothetical protein M422DRAFT_256606 [Sphaerobolus stellatus SS14]|uniref:Uncharacterized protein n=1 Tax=Sphaerobolus stellatus (strain SS14) TaxID=990650 RepID=A0A0C9UZV6_SPHS4|nr:hypothetical protein M422DRAFT_256606 [Sphaerobolus stellatus SS14]